MQFPLAFLFSQTLALPFPAHLPFLFPTARASLHDEDRKYVFIKIAQKLLMNKSLSVSRSDEDIDMLMCSGADLRCDDNFVVFDWWFVCEVD